MRKRVLFVCLGNICRSPAAEAVFRHAVEQRGLAGQIEIDSCGTGGWHAGEKADSRMRKAAQKRGFEVDSIARQLIRDDFSDFNYIIAMGKDNLLYCRNMCPRNVTPHIAIITDYISSNEHKEVPDPYYGGHKGFELVLDLLEEGCSNLLDSICQELS